MTGCNSENLIAASHQPRPHPTLVIDVQNVCVIYSFFLPRQLLVFFFYTRDFLHQWRMNFHYEDDAASC